ncbi:MAG: hypothetical protein DRI46_05160 [Chloroflexi bacterium]|nr:MAG: hypothetical protein DRI46_05160 [Chloroflexota bacterium]
MSISRRQFTSEDVQAVGNFPVSHYQPENRDGNWLRPSWDYMHSHPNLDRIGFGRIIGRSSA